MKVLGFIIAATMLFGLGFSGRVPTPKTPAERATVYLTDKFHGHTVTVEADDELIFTGHVFSHDAIQYAATVPLHIHTSPFTLRIRVDYFNSNTDPVFLEQTIHCEEGPYICVFLRETKLFLIQEEFEPEFY